MVGCGLSGLLAALGANKKGCNVVAIDKGIIGNDCSTVGAKQIAATGIWSKNGDGPDIHFEDTIKAGCYLNNEKLVRVLVDRLERVINDLDKMGMPFSRDENGEGVAVEGPSAGHSKARSLYFSDITGKMLIDTLYAECRRRSIKMYSEHIAVEIIKDKEGISGLLAVDLITGKLVFIRTKAIIIATGGIGRLYELTSNPSRNTGDGIALAMKAGAELMDLEFIQFYPCTALYPQGIRGMNLNSQYYGAQLFNSKGERFMKKYLPEEMELTTRDKLSRSIFLEILSGGAGPNGGVFLDATMIPAELYATKIPTEWDLAVSVGLDLTKDLLEIAPSSHYYMGGVRIDEKCRTTIKGLFATGECTSGVQGANRLANNGLAEALVFGVIAGEAAGEYASKVKMIPSYSDIVLKEKIAELQNYFSNDGMNSLEMMKQIQEVMFKCVGVVRNGDNLQKGIELFGEYASYKMNGRFNETWSPEILHGISVRNMITLATGIAKSAIKRKESRGAHYRSDYPELDDKKWRNNIILKMNENGELSLRRENVGARGCTDWDAIQ